MPTTDLAFRLRALVEVDNARRKIEKIVNESLKKVANRTAFFELESKKHNDLVARQHKAQKDVDHFELEAETLGAQEADKKSKLEHETKGSTCEHLEHELSEVLGKQEDLESELVQAWHLLDKENKALSYSEHEHEEIVASFEREILAEKTKLEALKTELETIIFERDKKISELPVQWQSRYSSMQQRVCDPIVPVSQGMCSSCFYQIIISDLSRLRNKEILDCKSCYRLLFVESEPEQARSDKSTSS
jgi:predicted  nucleic acid-binding Zn-ribbon protein